MLAVGIGAGAADRKTLPIKADVSDLDSQCLHYHHKYTAALVCHSHDGWRTKKDQSVKDRLHKSRTCRAGMDTRGGKGAGIMVAS